MIRRWITTTIEASTAYLQPPRVASRRFSQRSLEFHRFVSFPGSNLSARRRLPGHEFTVRLQLSYVRPVLFRPRKDSVLSSTITSFLDATLNPLPYRTIASRLPAANRVRGKRKCVVR